MKVKKYFMKTGLKGLWPTYALSRSSRAASEQGCFLAANSLHRFEESLGSGFSQLVAVVGFLIRFFFVKFPF